MYTVLLGSVEPKFAPAIDSITAPDNGAFVGCPDVSAGESKVKTETSVLTSDEIVNTALLAEPVPAGLGIKQVIAVPETQMELKHAVPPIIAVGDMFW